MDTTLAAATRALPSGFAFPTASRTGEPIAGARIFLSGTSRSATSGEDGSYVLANLPTGRVELRIITIGYQSQSAALTVIAGTPVTLDFQIERAVISLDQIVVTATGEQRKRELGNAIGSIQVTDLVEQAPVASTTDLLTRTQLDARFAPAAGFASYVAKVEALQESVSDLSERLRALEK